MKHLLFCLLILCGVTGYAQTPPLLINYQGVARSGNGNAIVSTNLSLKFEILQGSASGPVVYSEIQGTVNSNAVGIFNTQIGKTTTTLSAVNWNSGPHFLRVSLDTTGLSSFTAPPMGTQQLVSVPYALYAQSAATAPSPNLSLTAVPGGSVLTVGSNTVQLPSSASSPSTSIVTSGAISSTLVGNTYTLNTPLTTLSPTWTYGPLPTQTVGGLAQVIGVYPNFTVLVAPVIGYDPSVGTLSLSSANGIPGSYQYTYNITPTLSLNGTALSVGPASNSVNLPGLSAMANASIVSSGAASTATLGTNSYSIHVPQTSITSVNNSATITSTGTNSFNISVPAAITPSITGAGLASVNPVSGNSFTVTVPSPTFVSTNNSATVTTVGTNSFNVQVTPAVTPSITGAGLATVNPASGNSFTVSVSSPTFISSNNTATITSVGTNSFDVKTSAVTPSIAGAGAATVNPASGNSFTVNVAPTSVVSSNNSATVTPVGTNSFDISVSTPSITGIGAATVNPASGNNFTVSVAQTTVTSANNTATITSVGTNSFDVSVPQQVNITGGGAITVGGAYPNKTISTPSVTLTGGTTIFGTPVPPGLAQVYGSFPNFSIIVAPDISYNSTTGSLTVKSQMFTTPTYSINYNITPTMTFTNNVIQSGPTTNTVAIISPAAQAFAVNALGLTVFPGGTQLSTAFAFTKQSASSEIDVFVHTQANSGTFALASWVAFEIRVDNVVSAVSVPHYIDNSLTTEFITLKGVFSGLTAGPHTVSIWAKVNGGTSALVTLDPNNRGGKIILKETY